MRVRRTSESVPSKCEQCGDYRIHPSLCVGCPYWDDVWECVIPDDDLEEEEDLHQKDDAIDTH